MNTNTIGTRQQPMTLDQLGSVMMAKPAPYGFFVSSALWKSIADRWAKECAEYPGTVPSQFNGIKIAIDHSLDDTQFDVAFTEDSWRKRLIEIGASTDG